ncbi:MAG: 50S ribosomal protein L22 [Acetobacteraceae bacterium]|nr:50S ribosomal protein L22 [Acetobacteraceae bacterium]
MEARAVARFIRIAPRKVRTVAALIRGRPVEEALSILRFVPRRASRLLEKVVLSALANAEHNLNLKRGDLVVAVANVDQGPTLKRWHPRQRRRAYPILKRSSHITVVVREREEGR